MMMMMMMIPFLGDICAMQIALSWVMFIRKQHSNEWVMFSANSTLIWGHDAICDLSYKNIPLIWHYEDVWQYFKVWKLWSHGKFCQSFGKHHSVYPQEDVNIIQLLIRSNYAPYSWKFLRPSGHFLTDQIPPYFWVICVSLSAFKTGLSGKQHPWLGCLLETALCPRAESLVWSRAVGTRAFGPRADSTRSYQRFTTRAQWCFNANILHIGDVCF